MKGMGFSDDTFFFFFWWQKGWMGLVVLHGFESWLEKLFKVTKSRMISGGEPSCKKDGCGRCILDLL